MGSSQLIMDYSLIILTIVGLQSVLVVILFIWFMI